MLLENVYCPKCKIENCVYVSNTDLWKLFIQLQKLQKPLSTCSIFHLLNRKRQKLFSVEMLHIASPERQKDVSWLRSRRTVPLDAKLSAPIIINKTLTWVKKDKSLSVHDITASAFIGCNNYSFFLFESHFICFQYTVQHLDFLSFRRRNPLVSRIWTRFCYSDCKISDTWIDNELSRCSSASLKIVRVSKAKSIEQPLSLKTNHSQPARNAREEDGSCL